MKRGLRQGVPSGTEHSHSLDDVALKDPRIGLESEG